MTPKSQTMDKNSSLTYEWTGSAEQKLWGLMLIRSEVKYNFAFFHRLPDLDWDAEVQKRIPQVLAAQDSIAYYHVLQELVSLLNDGHTLVMFSRETRASLDAPPLELEMIEGKIIIVRVGETQEIRAQGIHPGMELSAVDGCPAREVLQKNALRYNRGGTPQWGDAFGLYTMLQGPKNESVNFTLLDCDGRAKTVHLKRSSATGEGQAFKHRILEYEPLIETRRLGSIVYFRLSTFGDEQIMDEFNREIDLLDLDAVSGMILDIRYNIGGDSSIAHGILARLTDRPLETEKWKTRKYVAAYHAWGNPEEWLEGQQDPVQPYPGKCYTGPLAVLIGPHTFSAAEDFLVPIVHVKRGTLIGAKTAGSTGQPLRVILPGGGYCLICTLQCTFPDGKEFVGVGIAPDRVVHPTQKDICENRDPVLEEAIRTLSNGPDQERP